MVRAKHIILLNASHFMFRSKNIYRWTFFLLFSEPEAAAFTMGCVYVHECVHGHSDSHLSMHQTGDSSICVILKNNLSIYLYIISYGNPQK